MAYNLGTAYIAVTATTKDMIKDINKALKGAELVKKADEEGTKAGKSFGDRFHAAAKTGIGLVKTGLKSLAPVGAAIGNGLVAGLKGAVVGAGALVTGLAAIGKQAVGTYADFEQLSGGTRLLFGDAARYVFESSRDAFRTVQMSQNDYLEQVNGFAVGLKTALGGDEMAAAQLATRIIQAEADISAATGVSSDRIQDAFNGIMKGNYQMLDNLQLGITPTKEGFQAMIDSVNAWNEAQGHATNYTIDNLADCEAALVDYVAMQGLAGHAGEEAASTISGSVSMMQAAWSNFLGDLAGANDNMETSISALVESISAVIKNVMPTVKMFVENISDALPDLLAQVMPVILDVVNSIAAMLPEILPPLVQGIAGALEMLAGLLPTLLPVVIESISSVLLSLVDTITAMLPTLVPILVTGAVQLFMALVQALPIIIPQLTLAITQSIDSVTAMLPTLVPQLLAAAVELFFALVQAIPQITVSLLTAIGTALNSAIDCVLGAVGNMLSAGSEVIGGLLDGVTGAIGGVLSFFGSIPGKIVSAIGDVGSLLLGAGKSIIDGFLGGLKAAWDGVTGFVGGIADWIVSHKGPPAYDATLLTANGMLIMESLGAGLETGFDRDVIPAIDKVNKGIADEFSGASLTKSLQADVRYNAAGDWKNVMGERPVIILNDAVLNDDYEMRQSALSLLKDIRRAAVQ